jgi:hypothetical protein
MLTAGTPTRDASIAPSEQEIPARRSDRKRKAVAPFDEKQLYRCA